MTTQGRLQEIINRLLARLKPEDMDAPGFHFESDAPGIDDGDYGGIRDTRPEWTREDKPGWIDLGPLGKP